MVNLPKTIVLREEGPREGFQMESTEIKIEDKVRLIDALSKVGLKHIMVTSFVSPKWVPQMGDAEEVAARFTRKPGIRYYAVAVNEQGVKRAHQTGKFDEVGGIGLWASEAMSRANTNKTIAETIATLAPWAKIIKEYGYPVTATMGCVFGCNMEGNIPVERVIWLIKVVLDLSQELNLGLHQIVLGDTMGTANPLQVMRVLLGLREEFPDIDFILHFHDTRGSGLANVLAALQVGITTFDSSILHLGIWPYAPGAAGNVATEDVAAMCEEMGIETGIDLDGLIECAKLAEEIVGHPLPGKVKVGGRVKH